jgi:hypothetical protein
MNPLVLKVIRLLAAPVTVLAVSTGFLVCWRGLVSRLVLGLMVRLYLVFVSPLVTAHLLLKGASLMAHDLVRRFAHLRRERSIAWLQTNPLLAIGRLMVVAIRFGWRSGIVSEDGAARGFSGGGRPYTACAKTLDPVLVAQRPTQR